MTDGDGVSMTTGSVPSLADADLNDGAPAPRTDTGDADSDQSSSSSVWILEDKDLAVGSKLSANDPTLGTVWIASLQTVGATDEVTSAPHMQFPSLEEALAWARTRCDVVRVVTTSGTPTGRFTAGTRPVPGLPSIEDWRPTET